MSESENKVSGIQAFATVVCGQCQECLGPVTLDVDDDGVLVIFVPLCGFCVAEARSDAAGEMEDAMLRHQDRD